MLSLFLSSASWLLFAIACRGAKRGRMERPPKLALGLPKGVLGLVQT